MMATSNPSLWMSFRATFKMSVVFPLLEGPVNATANLFLTTQSFFLKFK
jgi:hypothetical protein